MKIHPAPIDQILNKSECNEVVFVRGEQDGECFAFEAEDYASENNND